MPVETPRRSSTVSEPKRHAAEQVTSTLTQQRARTRGT